jgi:predicted membrane protein (TIGR00267 family)
MNGFDGALTTLGLIMGAYTAGALDPHLILTTGFGIGLALGIGGVTSAFVAEKAERDRSIKALEAAMFTSLEDTVITRASDAAVYFVALINALAPVAAAFVSLAPFVLDIMGILSTTNAFYLALAINSITLFILGVVLGQSSRKNILVYGSLMVLAGFATALVMILLEAAH